MAYPHFLQILVPAREHAALVEVINREAVSTETTEAGQTQKPGTHPPHATGVPCGALEQARKHRLRRSPLRAPGVCGIFRLTFSCRRLVLPRTSPWRRALRNSLANEARSRVRPPGNVNEQISGISAMVQHETRRIEQQPAAGGVLIAVILDHSPPASEQC